MLRDNWTTVQFNAYQQDKMVTQSVKGGNDKVFYSLEGTSPKSNMLVDVYPEYARLVTKYGRAHHFVDYTQFRTRLIRKEGVSFDAEPNDYGMKLSEIGKT
jgi:hypothetical protein